jgi:Zn-dependent protease
MICEKCGGKIPFLLGKCPACFGKEDRKSRRTVQVEENNEAEVSPVDSVLSRIIDRKKSKTGAYNNLLFLILSIVLFVSFGLLTNSVISIFFIVVTLLVHELGHLAGMVLFKYKNVQMFFIPFFGAAVKGESEKSNGFKECIISFMEPLPGIFISILLMILTKNSNPELTQLCIMLALINSFNLLPIYPLDGGRIVDTLIFKRNRYLQLAFRIVAVLLIIYISYELRSIAFAIFGLFTLILIKPSFIKAGIAHSLKSDPENQLTLDPDDRKFKKTVALIYHKIKSEYPQYARPDVASAFAVDIIDILRSDSPSIIRTIFLFSLYLFGLAAAFVSVGLIYYFK